MSGFWYPDTAAVRLPAVRRRRKVPRPRIEVAADLHTVRIRRGDALVPPEWRRVGTCNTSALPRLGPGPHPPTQRAQRAVPGVNPAMCVATQLPQGLVVDAQLTAHVADRAARIQCQRRSLAPELLWVTKTSSRMTGVLAALHGALAAAGGCFRRYWQ